MKKIEFPNGGFESGSIAPWVVTKGSAVVTRNANSGSFAMMLSGNSAVACVDIQTKKGCKYELTVYKRTMVNWFQSHLSVGTADNPDMYVNKSAVFCMDRKWSPTTVRFETSKDEIGKNTRVTLTNFGMGVPEVYFDDFTLLEDCDVGEREG